MTFSDVDTATRPLDAANRSVGRSRHASIAPPSYAFIKRALVGTALLLPPATQALAGGLPALWISNTNGSWFEAANWVEGIAPEAGVNARFGNGTFEDPLDVVDIDSDGNGVFQPGDTLFVNDKVQFLDGSAGGDAAFADDGMVFGTIIADGAGGQPVIFDVPITATTVESQRHGAVFNREISVTEILALSSHQDKWAINGGAIGSIARVLLDEQRGPDGDTIDGFLALNSTFRIDLLEHVWSELRVGSGAVATIGTYVYSDYTGSDKFSNINPIRAGMAETPEESDYTSIQQRVLEKDPKIAVRDPERIEALPEDLGAAIGRLMPFADQAPDDPERAIPYQIQDYLELVDWSGRAIVEGKRGKISDDLPPILERLKIDPDNYIRFINRTQKSRFHGFIGSVKSMQSLAADFGRSFLKGQAAAAGLFSPG